MKRSRAPLLIVEQEVGKAAIASAYPVNQLAR